MTKDKIIKIFKMNGMTKTDTRYADGIETEVYLARGKLAMLTDESLVLIKTNSEGETIKEKYLLDNEIAEGDIDKFFEDSCGALSKTQKSNKTYKYDFTGY